MRVRERDERLVTAAVMPAQVRGVESRRQALVEDALEVLAPVLVLPRLALLEKVRRRHLLRIAHDDALLRPRDDTDRIPDRNLRRLVEDDKVEARLCGQVLRDGKRAHQEARFQTGDHALRFCKKLTDRLLPSLLRTLAADETELAAFGTVPEPSLRQLSGEFRPNDVFRKFRKRRVQTAELQDLLLTLQAGKRRERRLGAQDLVERRLGNRVVIRLARTGRIERTRFESLYEMRADRQARRELGRTVAHHIARFAQRGDRGLETRAVIGGETIETPLEAHVLRQ